VDLFLPLPGPHTQLKWLDYRDVDAKLQMHQLHGLASISPDNNLF